MLHLRSLYYSIYGEKVMSRNSWIRAALELLFSPTDIANAFLQYKFVSLVQTFQTALDKLYLFYTYKRHFSQNSPNLGSRDIPDARRQ